MNNKVYEDGKYCIQDVGNIYVGCKYKITEFLDDEDIPFKLRLLGERYLFEKNDPEDTLETVFYYLDPADFHKRTYKQLRAKIKILILQEKGGKKQYATKMIPVEELAAMPFEEKEKNGVIVQELAVSKLALMTF